jgi:hypothetical protein
VAFLGEEVHLIDDHPFIIGQRRRIFVVMGAVKVEWELDSTGWRRRPVERGIHGRELPLVNISADDGVVVAVFRE